MTNETFKDIENLESDLWEAADNLRANSKLTSSDYFMPVLGIIFLRHAANRFETAQRQIEADQASGKMPKRKVRSEDYIARRSLYLPEESRYDWLMQQAALGVSDLPKSVSDAMSAIETEFEPLNGILPKDYGIFEPKVLEDLLRLFNSDQIKQATGDVFGRIYEYFLAKFSIQKAHDNGEFFTPSSLVQMIVNVIEPDHGTVFDPACGSGGMFVQSSHFIEREGGDTAKKVVFYGQEKNRDTINIAKMNLAVHGLEGKIAEAITYYQDEHNLGPSERMQPGHCDFVMANPPFNVDLVDAERIKTDPRLPFALPGVNKEKRVSNGNYLWISYFWSYLNEKGRAGFVMSSQASSAGHGEKEVRRKLVETGDVDVMISIRSNFFYTRSVPCELWHFDRGKPADRKDRVLMIDARNIYRKVTRKIYDFSPEQMQNLAAIVWLYRGQQNRFLGLVKEYLGRVCAESEKVPAALATFESTLAGLRGRYDALADAVAKHLALDAGKKQALATVVTELRDADALYKADAKKLLTSLDTFNQKHCISLPGENETQHTAREQFHPVAEAIRGLTKQLDLLYKLAARVADLGLELAAEEVVSAAYDRRAAGRLVKQLEEERKAAVEQLHQAVYFYRQAAWLQERFPDAQLQAVPGLVKLVDRKDIEDADWSLTPGRYVGVAPSEEDEDFDFEQTLRDIHIELADLNKEAVELAAKIQENFEELERMTWYACHLGDVLTLKRGHDLPDSQRQDGDVPVVSSSGVTGRHSEAKAKAPGVVTGRYGTLGEVFYIEEDYWPLNTALYVTDFKGNNPRFLAYFLQNTLLNYQSDKAAVPGVNRNVLHELEVRFPDSKTQEHIAGALSTYDGLIENNRRRMVLLEEAARQLYREWFVRLRFPGHEHTPVINGVPDGWERKNLGQMLTLKRGYDLPESGRAEGDIPIVSSSGITGFHDEKKAVAPGIVTGRYGTIGEVFFMQQDFWPLNTALYACDFKGNPPAFLAHLLKHALQGILSDKAAVPGVNRNVLHHLPVLSPPKLLIDQFAEFAHLTYKQIHTLESTNRKLRAARDLLLPRLMSGEIAV